MSKKDRERPLERLGIETEASLPEGTLTPGDAKSVRFKLSNPGYHYADVDAYKEQVDATFEAFVELLHERDLSIHKLDEEISHKETLIINLRNENEILSTQTGIAKADAEDEELKSLLEANNKLKKEFEALRREHTDLVEWGDEAEKYVASLESELEEYRKAEKAATLPKKTKEPVIPPMVETPPTESEDEGISIEDYIEKELNNDNSSTGGNETVEEQADNTTDNKKVENTPITPQPTVNGKLDINEVTKNFPGIKPEDLL